MSGPTPGPWEWRVDRTTKQVHLVALHSGTLYVMGFRRWGTRCAQPVFRVDDLMEDADSLSTEMPGQEHNESWLRTLDHGDARLIAASPTMYDALVEAEGALAVKSSLRDGEQARVQAALEKVRAALARATGADS